jgi:hypothetical protein
MKYIATYRNTAELVPHDLALSGMETGPDLQPEAAHLPHHRTRASDTPSRCIERSQKPITRGVEFAPFEPCEFVRGRPRGGSSRVRASGGHQAPRPG